MIFIIYNCCVLFNNIIHCWIVQLTDIWLHIIHYRLLAQCGITIHSKLLTHFCFTRHYGVLTHYRLTIHSRLHLPIHRLIINSWLWLSHSRLVHIIRIISSWLLLHGRSLNWHHSWL